MDAIGERSSNTRPQDAPERRAAAAAAPVLRFAPSPNGYLHLGHAYSALANERAARRLGARLILRMENIDAARCRPEFEAAILEDLAWLGVDFEPHPRRQVEHFTAYRLALQNLLDRGLLYPCFCARSDLARGISGRRNWPRDPDGSPRYPGLCKGLPVSEAERLALAQPSALRLDMERALAAVGGVLSWLEHGEQDRAQTVCAEPEKWGDVVLSRRDIPASYHIAVVVDDELQGVTDVVRGRDLFEATSIHRLLQALLGYRAPRYRHHNLLLDENGEKLSKRSRAKSIRSLRAQGVSANELRLRLGFPPIER